MMGAVLGLSQAVWATIVTVQRHHPLSGGAATNVLAGAASGSGAHGRLLMALAHASDMIIDASEAGDKREMGSVRVASGPMLLRNLGVAQRDVLEGIYSYR